MSFQSYMQGYWMQIIGGIVATVGVVIALFFEKYRLWAILGIAVIVLGVFAFRGAPDANGLDDRLPTYFADRAFPFWLLGLGAVALVSWTFLVIHALPARPKDVEGDDSLADIARAWNDILIQLSKARIDPAGQDLYLLLGPDESLAGSLIDASGLEFFVRAPDAPDVPIHAYAVKDALFLSCSGATSLGPSGVDGKKRLEFLCGLIARLNPERPVLRGVAVLVPFDWSQGKESHQRATAIREDLQAIRRALLVRCPTLTVCCLQESIPGFHDFAKRLPANLRHLRCGFSVPLSKGADASVIRKGMGWMTRWFQVWSLNLMVAKIRDRDGNGHLLGMNAMLRTNRDALSRLLESSLTVHQQDEPIFYRGCYFAAGGPDPEDRAFAAGLFNGAKKGRLLADRDLTTWSREADHLDRRYRLGAYALAVGSALLVVPLWWSQILPRLGSAGLEPAGWATLAALAVAWVVGLAGLPARRKPKPAR